MERDERRRAHALDRYWDATQRGESPRRPPEVDDVAARVVDHLARTPAPPGTNAAQLRVRQQIVAAANTTEETMHASALPLPVTVRVVRPPIAQIRPAGKRQPQLFLRLALAAALVLALTAGYARFGPVRTNDGGPANIPAGAFVTPDAATPAPASPTATLFPTEGHPIVGVWQTYNPCDPSNFGIAVFNADGSYLESEDGWGVIIGEWRATGERSVELVMILQPWPQLDPMFGVAKNVPIPEQDTGRIDIVASVSIELGADGTTLVTRGFYEPRRPNGEVITHIQLNDDCNFEEFGTRLADIAVVTPTP